MASSRQCCDCDAWESGRRQPMRDTIGARCPFPALATRFSLPRGQNIFHQGDAVAGLYSLASGMVAQERVDADGCLTILRILQPGALFPCSGLLGDGPHETAARALTDISGCFVPMERLIPALRDDPDITLALLRMSAAELREDEQMIFRLCSSDLPQRVLGALMTWADEMGAPQDNGDITVTLPVSWRDVAAMVGTGPEVISRLLRRLSKAGHISFQGRKVTLHPAATKRTTPTYC
ncbi:Crp/Fnr family transcriptional regulator [Paramagnetospirillum kuznetsovii]|uniref:Crp/Fnr family transcriptional regulator n=1 Tax=Paramagnetospirillum kuznetsovii TaxID=2053833 RepID=A0A364NU65_9PROT|nr:Crp/Fnr family transcriptional regulator [Paramagnetospirillum kuznetsovii]RAU20602.1 Crp/Fnr family transcriptional regulator [Paramagnetospirillum kuznetsovii]